MSKLKEGEGLANSLFTDSSLRKSFEQSIADLQKTSESLKAAATQLSEVTGDVRNGKGTVGALFSDSTTATKFKSSISNIEQGSARFSENMEALKHNFLFRRYFKKQKKTEQKAN